MTPRADRCDVKVRPTEIQVKKPGCAERVATECMACLDALGHPLYCHIELVCLCLHLTPRILETKTVPKTK